MIKSTYRYKINFYAQPLVSAIVFIFYVLVIMSYNGACRHQELTNILIDYFEYKTDVIFVSIRKTKQKCAETICNN